MTAPGGGGRVVDTAYVEIRPKAAPSFGRDLERETEAGTNEFASRFGARVGGAIGKGIGLAFRSPVVTGAIGTGLLYLQHLADEQVAAQGKLASAFQGAGADVSDYQGRIDKLVDANERLGITDDKTKTRLSELTLALNDPKKALDELGLAQDIAAGTGRSFESVVNLLRMANEGSVSAYAQLGIKVKDLAGAQKELHAAESLRSGAAGKLSAAQQSFNDKLAVYRQDTNHTLAQQQELYRSYEALQRAKAADTAASARVTAAQKETRSATYDQAAAVQTLADKYKGQASQGADTLTGHLKAFAAEARDSAGEVIAKYGPAAGGIGFALQGLAGATKVVRSAFTGLRDTEVATSAESAAAVESSSVAITTALAAEGAAAEATSAKVSTSAAGMIGKLGLIGGTLAAISFGADKLAHSLFPDLGSKAIPDDVFMAAFNGDQTAIDRYLNQPGLDYAAGQAGAATATRNDRDSNSDNPLTATRAQGGATGGVPTVVSAGTKLGKTAGKATVDGFADFLKQYGLGDPVNAALAAAHDKAVAGAQSLVDAVTAKLDAARSKFQSDFAAMRSEQLQVAQTVTQGSGLADAFTSGFSSARNPIGDRPVAGGGVAGVEAFLHSRAVKIARFAKALNQLRKKGLDARLIAEVAQLGTDEGLQVAEDLLAGSSSDIRAINLSSQQIARAANAVGANIASADYSSIISADKANTAELKAQLVAMNAKLAQLVAHPKAVSVAVRQSGASASEIGRSVGREVSLATKGM